MGGRRKPRDADGVAGYEVELVAVPDPDALRRLGRAFDLILRSVATSGSQRDESEKSPASSPRRPAKGARPIS